MTPQSGLFALGTSSHAYLEFDLLDVARKAHFVATIAALREPRTTLGGLNLVVGLRPELWREIAPDDAPADVIGFDAPLVGAGGFTMPATQHDAVLWLTGSAYDVIFDTARDTVKTLGSLATLADETSSWPYVTTGTSQASLTGPRTLACSKRPRWPSSPTAGPARAAASCCSKVGAQRHRMGNTAR
jgi:hypothetical protein